MVSPAAGVAAEAAAAGKPSLWYNRYMLDINFIRNNLAAVKHATKEKGYKTDLDALLALDDERRTLLTKVEALRTERNNIASQMKNGKPAPELIEQGKKIKGELSELEKSLSEIENRLNDELKNVPNIIFDDVPLGGEECSKEIKVWGEKHESGVDHLDYCESRDWVDFERGAKVAGSKFYYLKNELALLENALLQFGIETVTKHGLKYMTVPYMVSSKVLEGTGFAPKSSDQSDEYFIDGEDLAMIATAEMPITGYHADEILNEEDLPLFYAGYSACFRKEAGTYGKFTRGLFRVHQFNKLEMYAFCLPEQSEEIHQKLLGIEEEMLQALEIPYHIINVAAGDLGAPAAKKYDIEFWSPVDKKYREITSCSNCTDFQARSLNIRVRKKDGSLETVHTLNGTAIPFARMLMVLIENFATEGGKLQVPKVLQPYLGGKTMI